MTETILDHTSSLDGLLERLLPDPRLRGKEFERAANTPRRLPVLHPSICALDAVYSIVHRYGLFDDYKAAINKGFIENYCDYIEGTTPLVIRPARGLELAIGQTEDTLKEAIWFKKRLRQT